MEDSVLSKRRYQRETENCGTSASTAAFLAESVSETETCSLFFVFFEALIFHAPPMAPSIKSLLDDVPVVPANWFVVESLIVLPKPEPLSLKCQTPV